MSVRWAAAAVLVAAGCSSTADGLSVDLKTDFQAGVEFASVRTELAPTGGGEARSVDATVAFGDSFLGGRRIAEYAAVAPGSYTLRVELRDGRGATLAARTTRLMFSKAVAVTILVTRDCRGVTCPAPGGDPSATTCVGGRCVDPSCTTGMEPACMSECTADADCPAGAAACASARCVDGSCLSEPRDDRCAAGEYCAVDTGCRVRPVAAPDAGPRADAGPCTTPTAETCNGRDDDCDGTIDDGFDLTSDPNNCDVCGRACPSGPNATPVCTGGACSTTCSTGHADCNGRASDGCEADTSSSTTCGSCTRTCGSNSHCSLGNCFCDAGYEDTGTGTCIAAGTCPSGQQRYYTDSDRDGHGAGALCPGCFPIGAPPSGCAADNTDCNDADATKWQGLVGFMDRDGDGWGFTDPVPSTVCSGASLPAGYANRSGDCNDLQATVFPGNPSWYTSTGPSGGSWDYDCSGMLEVEHPGYQRCDSTIAALPLAYCDSVCTPTGTETGTWCTHSGAADCGDLTAVSVTGRCDTACNAHLSPGPTQGCH